MRTKNSLLNFLTSIVPFVVFVALGFLKIRVWQSSLDENIYALNQLFFQLFAYLSIAEAGIGALVQKEYYKLLIDEDHDMICKYYTVSKKMLRTVCYVIMAAGLILSFFLFTRLSAEFIPTLDEGDFAMQMTLPAGSSLSR